MDAIDEAFASGIVENHQLCAPLCHALSIGKKTLNKYYALTDNSDIYRIAMGMFLTTITSMSADDFAVLHPSFKTNYFSRLHWQKEWIEAAIGVTRDAWTSRYKPSPSTANTTSSSPPIVRLNNFFYQISIDHTSGFYIVKLFHVTHGTPSSGSNTN